MAVQKIYVPVYTNGKDGKKTYQFAILTGTLSTDKVPAGEPCISSRVMTSTPSADLQPEE